MFVPYPALTLEISHDGLAKRRKASEDHAGDCKERPQAAWKTRNGELARLLHDCSLFRGRRLSKMHATLDVRGLTD
jgi:hypothetical protein